MNSQTKRLFVAVDLPQEIKQELELLQNELRKFARDVKWVRIEGIHLTLKFFGYVDATKVPAIKEALQPVADTSTAFSVKVQGCGFFPNSRRPNVLWCGIISPELLVLQEKVEESMARLNFEKESRAFAPHLTLARFRDPRGLLLLAQNIETRRETTVGEFSARSLCLYESILHREGAEYHVLESFPLRDVSE